MTNSKKIIIFFLMIPIMALASLIFYKRHILTSGEEVTLPITGYDPRDLLSGHYLVYEIQYGIDICPKLHKKGIPPIGRAYVCLRPKKFSYERPQACELMLKGHCASRQFRAGIEKYYIPETKAKEYEDLLRTKKADIVLSVLKNGHANVKDLLIDGESLKDQ